MCSFRESSDQRFCLWSEFFHLKWSICDPSIHAFVKRPNISMHKKNKNPAHTTYFWCSWKVGWADIEFLINTESLTFPFPFLWHKTTFSDSDQWTVLSQQLHCFFLQLHLFMHHSHYTTYKYYRIQNQACSWAVVGFTPSAPHACMSSVMHFENIVL